MFDACKEESSPSPLLLFCMLSSDTHGSTMQNISKSVGEKGRKAADVWSKYLEQKLSFSTEPNLCLRSEAGRELGWEHSRFFKIVLNL